MAQTIRSASGTAMRPWPEETPFCAWRGRAPQQESSGGKGRKRRPWKHRNRAPHACRMAAPSVRRSHCAFGAFSRRLQGRLGPAQALGATAPTSARTVEPRRKHRMPYPAIGAAASTQRCRARAAVLPEESRQARLYALGRFTAHPVARAVAEHVIVRLDVHGLLAMHAESGQTSALPTPLLSFYGWAITICVSAGQAKPSPSR